ncbi:MAG: PQQ-dependent sugar dehydrogenase [Thermoleophilia bacterium]|nr:PQQ-dependent sugar dehydrogenase [Thermoleophilia bacterium]MDH4339221.1 PQQ-dependent sugar dehydrogenase [Thermoleophilia bacterium]MDH5280976.1 PQQ-dependent sugar dehydrogenase [Thermoleophilia bacterium]
MRVVPVLAVLLFVAILGAVSGSAVAADSAFRLVVVARGFDSPVGFAHAKNEPRRLFVVEQRGTVRVIDKGKVRSGFFLDVRGRVQAGGEQGLLGLAFDPKYRTNRFIYVNYTDASGDTRVVRFKTRGSRALLSSARVLLRVDQPYGNHNGGGLAFGPDGFLYVGLGDGGSGGDPENRAQDMSTLLGKMLRLDVRKPGSPPGIVGLGLRNPWRYSFDRQTGDLYIGDVGQGKVEEVDFTPHSSAGLENYGWDLFEGSRRYEEKAAGPGELVLPVFEYGHDRGCSVVGGFVYRGKSRPAERGRYVVGDYCSGSIWSFKVVSGEARAFRTEPFKVGSLTSFGEDAAGELYAVSQNGAVYRLT